jgi:hypothetical protein
LKRKIKKNKEKFGKGPEILMRASPHRLSKFFTTIILLVVGNFER